MKPNTHTNTPRLTSDGKRFLDAVTRTKALHALEVLKAEIANHNWLDATDKRYLSKVLQDKIDSARRSNTALDSSQGYRNTRRKFLSVY